MSAITPFLATKVACIMDEFSYAGFKYEARFLQLEPESWQAKISNFQPDLFFVESVWEGKNRSWRHRFLSPIDSTLKHIVDWCRERRIPVVFWNKEDPPNFRLFLDNARLCDYVLTTDRNSVAKYQRALNHDRISVLPFAAQPYIHNPIDRNRVKLGQVAFAGTWYQSKYPERRSQLDIMLRQAMHYDLTIFDRMHHSSDTRYQYPDMFQPYLRPSIPYNQMVTAYKQYEVFLNVDSVNNSPTMFSRRVYELLASGTPVISSYSKGIAQCLPEVVALCRTEDDWIIALKSFLKDHEYRDRISLQGQRAVFSKHTYRHRVKEILDLVGIESPESERPVSVIAIIRSPRHLVSSIDNYVRQSYFNKRLFLFTHRTYLTRQGTRYFDSRNDIEIYSLRGSLQADKIIMDEILQVPGPYVWVLNEYDYYGPEFLSDLMHALNYSQAAAAGKGTYYVFHPFSTTITLSNPHNEYQYGSHINPWAMVLDKSKCPGSLHDIHFHNLPDTLRQNGLPVYSAERFQYIYNYYACHHNLDPNRASWKHHILV